MGILPPTVKREWDENDVWAQASILAYAQLRDYEDSQTLMGGRV